MNLFAFAFSEQLFSNSRKKLQIFYLDIQFSILMVKYPEACVWEIKSFSNHLGCELPFTFLHIFLESFFCWHYWQYLYYYCGINTYIDIIWQPNLIILLSHLKVCNIISAKVIFTCTLSNFSNAVILRLRCLEALALH